MKQNIDSKLEKNSTMTSKLKSIMIGGLLLAAPFVSFAAASAVSNTNNNMQNTFSSMENSRKGNNDMERKFGNRNDMMNELNDTGLTQEHIDRLDKSIELKIANSNLIINKLIDKNITLDIDIEQLRDIVDELGELETELEMLDIDETLKDDLRDIFWETKEEMHGLDKEFRELISGVFTDKEREEIREEILANRKEILGEDVYLNTKYQERKKNHRQDKSNHMGNLDGLRLIDENIALMVENEKITIQEAHLLAAEKMEAMTDEELEALQEVMMKNFNKDGFGQHRGNGNRMMQHSFIEE